MSSVQSGRVGPRSGGRAAWCRGGGAQKYVSLRKARRRTDDLAYLIPLEFAHFQLLTQRAESRADPRRFPRRCMHMRPMSTLRHALIMLCSWSGHHAAKGHFGIRGARCLGGRGSVDRFGSGGSYSSSPPPRGKRRSATLGNRSGLRRNDEASGVINLHPDAPFSVGSLTALESAL